MYPFSITAAQYNYTLAVPGFRQKMLRRDNRNGTQSFRFFGTHDDWRDFLNRCRYL